MRINIHIALHALATFLAFGLFVFVGHATSLLSQDPISQEMTPSLEPYNFPDTDLIVKAVRVHGYVANCSGLDRTYSQLFLTVLIEGKGLDGYAAISFPMPAFHISSAVTTIGALKSVHFPVRIGSQDMDEGGIVDGNSVTFGLSKQQFEAAASDQLVINGVTVDHAKFVKLGSALKKCVADGAKL